MPNIKGETSRTITSPPGFCRATYRRWKRTDSANRPNNIEPIEPDLNSESRPPYIEFENVVVRYTPHVHGLRNVSLVVRRGDFVFLVGRTGAGKSTLLKLLTREAKHDEGFVRLHGRDLGQVRDREIPALRREMGIVPQDFALLPRKRVWENVAFALRAVGNSRRTVRRRVPEILERVSMGHRADAFPHQLSGGEQQRVAIGRALINNPPLILADEPTGNLDPEHSWEIMELLRSLNARGATVVVATHDMAMVERMGRRVITLEAGEILHDSAPGGYMSPPPHQHELELGTLPWDRLVSARQALFDSLRTADSKGQAESQEEEATQHEEAPGPEPAPALLLDSSDELIDFSAEPALAESSEPNPELAAAPAAEPAATKPKRSRKKTPAAEAAPSAEKTEPSPAPQVDAPLVEAQQAAAEAQEAAPTAIEIAMVEPASEPAGETGDAIEKPKPRAKSARPKSKQPEPSPEEPKDKAGPKPPVSRPPIPVEAAKPMLPPKPFDSGIRVSRVQGRQAPMSQEYVSQAVQATRVDFGSLTTKLTFTERGAKSKTNGHHPEKLITPDEDKGNENA
jgi:cell division transport system ATP-binding protein